MAWSQRDQKRPPQKTTRGITIDEALLEVSAGLSMKGLANTALGKEVGRYSSIFDEVNKTRSGKINKAEAQAVFDRTAKLSPAEVAEIWKCSDIDKDGKLTLTEFICAMQLVERKNQAPQEPPVMITNSSGGVGKVQRQLSAAGPPVSPPGSAPGSANQVATTSPPSGASKMQRALTTVPSPAGTTTTAPALQRATTTVPSPALEPAPPPAPGSAPASQAVEYTVPYATSRGNSVNLPVPKQGSGSRPSSLTLPVAMGSGGRAPSANVPMTAGPLLRMQSAAPKTGSGVTPPAPKSGSAVLAPVGPPVAVKASPPAAPVTVTSPRPLTSLYRVPAKSMQPGQSSARPQSPPQSPTNSLQPQLSTARTQSPRVMRQISTNLGQQVVYHLRSPAPVSPKSKPAPGSPKTHYRVTQAQLPTTAINGNASGQQTREASPMKRSVSPIPKRAASPFPKGGVSSPSYPVPPPTTTTTTTTTSTQHVRPRVFRDVPSTALLSKLASAKQESPPSSPGPRTSSPSPAKKQSPPLSRTNPEGQSSASVGSTPVQEQTSTEEGSVIRISSMADTPRTGEEVTIFTMPVWSPRYPGQEQASCEMNTSRDLNTMQTLAPDEVPRLEQASPVAGQQVSVITLREMPATQMQEEVSRTNPALAVPTLALRQMEPYEDTSAREQLTTPVLLAQETALPMQEQAPLRQEQAPPLQDYPSEDDHRSASKALGMLEHMQHTLPKLLKEAEDEANAGAATAGAANEGAANPGAASVGAANAGAANAGAASVGAANAEAANAEATNFEELQDLSEVTVPVMDGGGEGGTSSFHLRLVTLATHLAKSPGFHDLGTGELSSNSTGVESVTNSSASNAGLKRQPTNYAKVAQMMWECKGRLDTYMEADQALARETSWQVTELSPFDRIWQYAVTILQSDAWKEVLRLHMEEREGGDMRSSRSFRSAPPRLKWTTEESATSPTAQQESKADSERIRPDPLEIGLSHARLMRTLTHLMSSVDWDELEDPDSK